MSDQVKMGEAFSVTVPAQARYRSAMSAFITAFCEELTAQNRFNEETNHQIMSAFMEGFNNVVTHAYASTGAGRVELVLSVNADHLSLALYDEGKGFDFKAVPVPELDTLPEGGMGIYIMKNFMDHVEYKRDKKRNMLYMEKRYV